MEKLDEILVVQALGWLDNAATLDVIRKQPVQTYEKLPNLSVQPEVAVAVKFMNEPRDKTKDEQDFAFVKVELIEPAIVWTKENGQFEAPKGTKTTMNLKRHAGLYRAAMRISELKPTGLTDKEVVIANLGKRTFKTPKAPRGTATGYEYRVMLLAELKKKLEKK